MDTLFIRLLAQKGDWGLWVVGASRLQIRRVALVAKQRVVARKANDNCGGLHSDAQKVLEQLRKLFTQGFISLMVKQLLCEQSYTGSIPVMNTKQKPSWALDVNSQILHSQENGEW